MATTRHRADIFDLVTSVARVVDMMSPAIGNHHMRVAYLAYRIGEQIGIPVEERHELVMAGALHDVGAFSLQERLDLLEFEDSQPGEHCMAGYLLLKDFDPFASVAKLIKSHHTPWKDGKGAVKQGEPVLPGSHIIHLADRVVVKIGEDEAVLGQVRGICEAVTKSKHDVFVPEYVDAVLRLSKRDHIWLEVTSDCIESILRKSVGSETNELDVDALIDFSRLICRLVDFKSEYTATHSTGVAATAVAMSELVGFSREEKKFMEIAAYFHDLGKMAIPSEILEKPGRLSDVEWGIMRSHVNYTHEILEPIDIFGVISSWSALHQERLDGTGYPFGYKAKQLPLGSRIMGVADVFAALTENRPYREGMDKKEAMKVLRSLANHGKLDKSLVNIALENFDEMNEIRELAQEGARHQYTEFRSLLAASGIGSTP
jgi:HD-GYP domain-containing protein (c-di-GMP phosphodiesterase class II)